MKTAIQVKMKSMGLLLCVFLCAATLFAQTEADFNTRAEGSGVVITRYRGQGGDVAIPAAIGGKAVIEIGHSAFSWNDRLTSVTIPESVTSIGGDAFAVCSGLASIRVSAANQQYKDIAGVLFTKDGKTLFVYPADSGTTAYAIPAGVTAIANRAFSDCSNLTSVIIPAGVTSIGEGAFSGCSGLTSVVIPASVTSISDGAFSNCSNLTSVIIPASVTSIGARAFAACSGLASITVSAANQQYKDIEGALFTEDGKTLLAYPVGSGTTAYAIPAGVTTIANMAFFRCAGLVSVTIPASVTSIGGDAFAVCSGLTSITIPVSVTSIGSGAFAVCSSLTSITIPASVTSVGSGAFYDCNKLEPGIRSDIENRFGSDVFYDPYAM